MAANTTRRAYRTLEGLRAVGAFLVVMRHVPSLFVGVRVPESFLAVDLFYLVSGFVVAHAYGPQLAAGGSFSAFIKTRIIRLYPLYLVGLAVGIVVALIAVIGDPAGWWNWTRLATSIVTGVLMIPMFPGLPASGTALDGPIWTLLPELIANAVYARFIRFMNLAVVLAIMALSAAGLVVAAMTEGTLDVGYNPTDQWAALARVGYSFFAGVLIHRFVGAREHRSAWASWICLAVLGVILAVRPPEDWASNYELAVILFGFPALIAIAATLEPGPVVGRAFSRLGLLSYGVYLLHQPLGHLIETAVRWFHIPIHRGGAFVGLAFIVAVVALSEWLDKAYDAPVRKVLRARFLGPPPRSPPPSPDALGSAPEAP
jgi:peptidoglycan/LPS O-acetylase OafA/YrhL